ncbi:polysaccharide biosynthesis protein [Pontiellaceae bacterium B12219]|nr:polysaccharide biosynthesis protein [Pontiellaceae bacterium B12219]
MVTLTLFGVHRGLYRYVSLYDFITLFKAITVGSIAFAVLWLSLFNQKHFMPRSIYLLDWILCILFLGGLRIAVRLWHYRKAQKQKEVDMASGCRALIVGAGNLGENTLRMIDQRFLGQNVRVVGFVDSDEHKFGSFIHGVPVLGKPDAIPCLIEECSIQLIVFSISDPPAGFVEEVVHRCDGLNVRFNTVSVLQDLETGGVSVDRMRRLCVEDLLGRKPVEVDTAPVQRALSGQTVLVTGAGGSIGSELCRQIASFGPSQLILMDAGETPTFEIDRELQHNFPNLDIQPFIGDIKHEDVVKRVFSEFKPDYVYHAAAYKHVPLMEAHPDEAVLNNVRGTRLLAEAARQHSCKRFVMISSDKAVRPSNVMGATKRMCELVIQSMNGAGTVFAAVRFGNVLGSNGSVIPIFRKQIEAGGPLTVTHQDMTRYFMTIPEAVTLVLQCGVIAEAGDVFVLDMGTPVKIMDLARNMIRLSGLRENNDISIEVTGLRPGEKMYEELVAYGEELIPTRIPKVNVLKQTGSLIARDVFLTMIRHLEDVALNRRVENARKLLWRMTDLDIERAQGGMETLIGKSMDELISEWFDMVSLSESRWHKVSRGRILAVVGSSEIQEVLTATLNAVGYELDCVCTSEQALLMLATNPLYSAVLCDFIAPDEPAWKFRDKVRLMGSDLPVIAMSQYDSATVLSILEIDHKLTVLKKPFGPEAFEKAIEQASPSSVMG